MAREMEQDNEEPVLFASLDNVKKLANLLKAVHFKDRAMCYIGERGLRFTVEDAASLQANAFVQADLFQRYEVREKTEFAINLTLLLECLNIFGASSTGGGAALKMSYAGYGAPLVLVLAEHSMSTDCEIKTMEADLPLDMNFRGSEVDNKVIIKAEWMKPVFAELVNNSDTFEVLMSPDKPYFRLSVKGMAGEAYTDYPRDSEAIESFESRRTQASTYRISLIKPCAKALAQATKVSVRMNGRAFLSMQFMIEGGEGAVSFVEYVIAPEEDDDYGSD